jgi:hypothetical protein
MPSRFFFAPLAYCDITTKFSLEARIQKNQPNDQVGDAIAARARNVPVEYEWPR